MTAVTTFITNLANSVVELSECHKRIITQVVSAMEGITMMYDAMSFLRFSGVGAVMMYASLPVSIYPVIALGTLGLKKCNTGINARMASSAQYSVRSMNIGAMSVGKGSKCIPDYNWDEAVIKIANHAKKDRGRWKNKTIEQIVNHLKLINKTGTKHIAKNKNEIIVSKDENFLLIKNRYDKINNGTVFVNKKKNGKKRTPKETKNYVNDFLEANDIDNSI